MSNIEFDKKVRELMEVHSEVPPVDSWSHIEMSLNLKRKAKMLYFRKTLYATVAVAASLVMLLVLNKSSYDFKDVIEVVDHTDVNATLESQNFKVKQLLNIDNIEIEPLVPKKALLAERKSKQARAFDIEEKATQKLASIQEVVSTQEVASTQEKITTQEKLSFSEEVEEVSTPEKTVPTKKTLEYSYPPLDNFKSVRRRKGSPILAFATNISPSTGSHSVSLMAMSQAQGGFAPNNVVSTVQKGSVPQEVISNTKFLMPLSVGVQMQMPISKLLSVGLGVNYTLLFSNYDAISRQETRETQQTLHYIGVPLNLYLNIMQKDNLRLYATGGVALEKGVYAFYRVSENGVRRSHGESIDGIQFSLTGGLGVELAVNSFTGLYFDPTVAFFFDNNQPISSRTSQPLQFKFELGFRFHL